MKEVTKDTHNYLSLPKIKGLVVALLLLLLLIDSFLIM